MRKGLLLLILIFLVLATFAESLNSNRQKIKLKKTSKPPKIDGILDETIWKQAVIAKDFVQLEPYNGKQSKQPTEVRVLYDDQAIYFGAIMHDSSPDSIIHDLGTRDQFSRINADLFGVIINTFNDGVNAVEFMISASGVQSDCKHTGERSDSKWDAVWESKVNITKDGWIAEIKVPYSALRFSNKDIQNWGIQFFRSIRRHREWSSWNFIDINVRGKINQMGEAVGIENIEPPLRLSVTPYISTYFENEGNWNKDFNAGMDLKWGINQSFTLDMILIPDFGQIQSDDKILNLSPFEVKYNEKRAFFTEGTELFNKAEILYSRRIGSRPKRAKDIDDILLKNEVVQTNPIETKLINATKISGRTNNGLGIGFLNAITDAADAEIKDTITNETRLYRTQSFTNYNMLVLDQTLKNNSYISLANTNVLQPEDDYMANVTGTEFKLKNKENSYQFFGRAALSQIYTNTNSFGHKYLLIFSKTRGNYLFDLIHNTESNTYDPNDMGFIRRNNKSIWRTNLKYNKNEPFWKVLNWHNELTIYYQNLYKPRKYNDFFIRFSSNTTFTKSYFHTGITFKVKPFSTFDYFEPRDPEFIQKFKRPKLGVFNWWASSDYRKRLAFDLNFGAREDWEKDYNSYGYWFKLAPRVRITDKWLFVYSFKGDNNFKSYGYVDSYDDSNGNRLTDFGKRDQYTFTHTLNTSYIFNSNMSVNLRIRHYWSRVKYLDFYTLQPDGSMGESLGYEKYGNDKDYNYNAFTIDMKYLWRFAPGSEIALVWKNSIYADQNDIINNAWDNLNNTLETSQINSLSFKLLYYLDYQYLAKSRKHNK